MTRPAESFLAGRSLPHRLLPNWLGEAEAARLLDFSIAAEARFIRTRLNGRVDSGVRSSVEFKDHPGAFASPLRRKALALQAGLETAFEMAPSPPNGTQIEIVAHGDGAFYRPHTDTYIGDQ